jgi:hypothetical protein
LEFEESSPWRGSATTFASLSSTDGNPANESKPYTRRVRFSGSSIVLNLHQLINPKPRNTPHSTIEPLIGKIILKISYSAKNRLRCWRRTYFGKFSSLCSVESEFCSKMLAIEFPTCNSAAVRKVFIIKLPFRKVRR